jgi:hypothetical protein
LEERGDSEVRERVVLKPWKRPRRGCEGKTGRGGGKPREGGADCRVVAREPSRRCTTTRKSVISVGLGLEGYC